MYFLRLTFLEAVGISSVSYFTSDASTDYLPQGNGIVLDKATLFASS